MTATATLSIHESAPVTPIFMTHGLPGFPEQQHFVMEPIGPARYWLRAEGGEGPDFAVIEPGAFIRDFAPDLPLGIARQLGANSERDLTILAIVTLPRDVDKLPTVNLQGLLVAHLARGLARQVILTDSPFGVRTPLKVA